MDTSHNHPPICCCPDLQRESYSHTCPLCPEHGESTHANAECPSCHQLPGRPPTDYCNNRAWHWARYDQPDQTSQPATLTSQPSTKTRDTEALCGFRSLANPDLACTYPPHRVDKPHSWQALIRDPQWQSEVDARQPKLVCRRCNGYGMLGVAAGVNPVPCPDCTRRTPPVHALQRPDSWTTPQCPMDTPLATPTPVATHGPRTEGHIDLPPMPIPPELPPDE